MACSSEGALDKGLFEIELAQVRREVSLMNLWSCRLSGICLLSGSQMRACGVFDTALLAPFLIIASQTTALASPPQRA